MPTLVYIHGSLDYLWTVHHCVYYGDIWCSSVHIVEDCLLTASEDRATKTQPLLGLLYRRLLRPAFQ
ncbi:hypothetical protein GE061_014974 [Apolygus lucorum]|uniref:Uncharacterized protein n=1 Tax=Apolygus lucorum TaxID=248454 RepID=A0A8S9XKT6_APOLU|nr:hypothetical protein GE061_014974 [Apolygus lucorum]